MTSTVAHGEVLLHEERVRGVQLNTALSESAHSAYQVLRSIVQQLAQLIIVLRDVELQCASDLSGSLRARADIHHSEREANRQRREEQVLPSVLFAYN